MDYLQQMLSEVQLTEPSIGAVVALIAAILLLFFSAFA